jgi:glucose uptake protein
MFQPEAYAIALMLMLVSMICWGSWANTQKLTVGYAVQLYYWDYVIGMIVASLLWGFSFGSLNGGESAFVPNLFQASHTSILLALLGGVVFNIANILLVISMQIAGMAVAFPIGIGLALVIGVGSNYVIDPRGNPILLCGGVAFVVAAIVVDAIAYKCREGGRRSSMRGVGLSVASGILMGLFYPFIAKSAIVDHPLGPYAVAFVFALGVAVCAIPLNSWMMRKPIAGDEVVSMKGYWKARKRWHFWGVMGGAIWCTGALFNFVASHAHIVGPATSYAIGQGATMVSAAWGVFVWREFASAPAKSRRLIPFMFVLFIVGLAAIAVAPMF